MKILGLTSVVLLAFATTIGSQELGTITFPITHGRTSAYGFWATRPEAVEAVRRTLVEQCPAVDSRSKCELAPGG